MSAAAPSRRPIEPPARTLRLLANLWLPAAVVFGLTTVGLVAATVQSVGALVGGAAGQGAPVTVLAGGALLGGLGAVVLGRITWRLAVEVPRVVRGWEDALADRRHAEAG